MYKIHQIEDVFSNKKRKKLIKDCQPLLKDLGEGYPGRQTYGDLYLHPDFISPINHILKIILKKTKLDLVIDNKVWINWTNGKKKDFSWHDHPSDYALVYYMKIPLPFFSNGTLFEGGFVRAPQNSMIIFPANLVHTAPTSPFRFDRYTMSMNLNIRNSV